MYRPDKCGGESYEPVLFSESKTLDATYVVWLPDKLILKSCFLNWVKYLQSH